MGVQYTAIYLELSHSSMPILWKKMCQIREWYVLHKSLRVQYMRFPSVRRKLRLALAEIPKKENAKKVFVSAIFFGKGFAKKRENIIYKRSR